MIKVLREWVNRYFSDPQVIILAFLLIAGFLFILTMGDMLTPVLAGAVIAYLLEGVVALLQRYRTPRLVAVILVFLLFMTCLIMLIFILIPLLVNQIGQLLQEVPSMIIRGQKELTELQASYPQYISEGQINQITSFLGGELTKLGQHIPSISVASVRGLLTLLVYLILVPLLVFFFLKDKVKIMDWLTGFLPADRELSTEVWREVNQQIGNYVRGKIWEIFIVWGVSYITFITLELKFTMLLSLFVGLSVLVPYIGATIMFFPVGLVAYFQWGWDSSFIYAMTALGIIQALDGNLLVPLLLGEVVDMHPVAIIVAVLVFGGLWGIWGLVFAIPLATLVHAVIKAWVKQRLTRNKKDKT
ncbi:AI-2E family transporter [Desulfococcaceae bacterium HSG9]|nr:AI-2E family transporter [Desulfococcaceae bacterium HSG9]